nr:hypothetical protein [uncultured Deefgea sp.]
MQTMTNYTNFIANYYRICHISYAIIPSSRLSKILASMYQGEKITLMSLSFLKQEGFHELYRLASGEITRETYIAELGTDHLRKNHAAELVIKAAEDALQERATHFITRKNNIEAERNLRRKREREANEADAKARLARQTGYKEQRILNIKMAATAYQLSASKSGFTPPTRQELIGHFHLSHIEDDLTSRIIEILGIIFRGEPLNLNDTDKHHLKGTVPILERLTFGMLSFEAYIIEAKEAESAALARKARDDAEKAARIARESDPEYIAMIQAQALLKKYEVLSIDSSLISKMTKILQHLDTGNRLAKEDLEWLGTNAKKYFTKPVRKAYHRLEADFHANQYRRQKDSWNAINACGHYRQCDLPDLALELIDSIERNSIRQPKVKSAVLTTRGGVMRDLNQREEAIQMGEAAHALMPQDYRPCTLLGAVHMELRCFEQGHAWYEKARTLGAPENGIDSDIRSIYRQLDSSGQENMKRALLAEDPFRYSWLNVTKSKSKHPVKN